MKTSVNPLECLLELLSACLTDESAHRLVSLKPDRDVQARIDEFAQKCSGGTLTSDEREEYGRYITFGTFVSTRKAKARLVLAQSRTA